MVWKKYWRYLKQFNLPIWYVGNHVPLASKIAWNDFISIGGQSASDLSILEKDNYFKQLAQHPFPRHAAKITDYKGIIVVQRKLKLYNPSSETLEDF